MLSSKMRTLSAAAVLLLALSPFSFAAEVAGVQMPDTMTVDGKTLKLNGAGLRKKVLFKVYVAGLYLETPSKDASAVLSAAEAKSMRLHVLRSLKGSQVSEAISEGFERNSKEQLPKLSARLEKLKQMIPDVKEGDEILFTWLPEKGTQVTVLGTDRGVIEGRDFADALFAVWLGPSPVQEDLKKALLGG
jgi:Chalcone isomerase-like